jgi:hypothetical protein
MPLTKEEQALLSALEAKRDAPSQAKKLVHVISLLDKSGSMVTGKSRTISAFNENAQIMRSEEDANTRVTSTFITFESNVKVVFAQSGVNRLEPLTDKSFVPAGGTALYDGIGEALDLALTFEAAYDADTSFLLQITTDGEENSSKRYHPHQLKSRIDDHGHGSEGLHRSVCRYPWARPWQPRNLRRFVAAFARICRRRYRGLDSELLQVGEVGCRCSHGFVFLDCPVRFG